MMRFRVLEPGIELYGDAIGAMVDGFGPSHRAVAMKYLVAYGVLKPESGKPPVLDRLAWYSQEAAFASYEAIVNEVGWRVFAEYGRNLPANVKLPPFITDIHSSYRFLDVGYHLHHRKNGLVMFNEVTGKMQEGIGHYGYEPVDGEKKIVVECTTPYPCELDVELVRAMGILFEPRTKVVHDESQPCRRDGADSCTYVITW